MDARELRIGNWVQTEMFGHKKYWQVSSVEIRDCEHYGDNWSFKPIRLTPEMLEKCGFYVKSHTHCTLWKDGKLTLIQSYDSIFYLDSPHYGKQYKYLHQLQNLYFALTQTELPINL